VAHPSPDIDPRVVAVLRCPRCAGEVKWSAACITCASGHLMPVVDGYIEASPPPSAELQATFDSFGYEWTTFDRIMPEDAAFWSSHFRDVPFGELRDALALDAGCGKGRFSHFTAPHVAHLVALDGSAAVEAAARNLAAHPNCTVLHADLLAAPLVSGSFGFVYCLGVLHHLPDPQLGFRRLVDLVEPGGLLFVYLYSRARDRGTRRVGLSAARALRTLTTRLPHRVVRGLSAPLALVLYGGLVLPGSWGQRRRIERLTRLPLATYRGRPWRSLWLDTFDRLSAPIERRYLWSELEPWFAAEGLVVETVREDAGWFVLARKPAPEHGSPSIGRP